MKDMFIAKHGENIELIKNTKILQNPKKRDREGEKKKATRISDGFRDPSGVRTQDPNIKSVVLYQLS